LAIPLAEIAIIGDGGNDVAMFERSGLSVAMGNASPQVQQAADFVTDSNREEGLANAVERFILGGGRSSKRVEAPLPHCVQESTTHIKQEAGRARLKAAHKIGIYRGLC
jgi:hypothetical protein